MDKKTIIYVVLLGVVLLFYFPIMEKLGVIQPADQNPAVDTTVTQPASETTSPGQTTDYQPAVDQTSIVENTAAMDTTEQGEVVPVDTITIVTDKYTAKLSTYGGGLVSLKLNDYSYRDGEPIEIMPNASEAAPMLSFAGGSFLTSNKNFTSSLMAGNYEVTSNELVLSYTHITPAGTVIKKNYKFFQEEYHFDLDVEVINPEKTGLSSRYSIIWNTPLGVTEPQPKTDYDVMEVAAMLGGSREKLADFDDGKLKESIDGDVTWGGLRSKYFAAVFIPTNREGESVFARGTEEEIDLPDGSSVTKREITGGLDMLFAASFSDNYKIFVGPLDYQVLAKYNNGLEDILDIGTTPFIGWLIKIFAVPIMHILPFIYKFIPNYGIVIILFALLVKLVTLPLSMKSFKSMNAMKELQPKMDELKKKHKKNPQALNKEMMTLYKENGVNPISGCLPMLPQMPLFFAMFAVFRSTILLRDAPFFWFIDDLSRGATSFTDPYILLVVFMVVAQFVSQNLTMASNQQNKMLLYLMPLFMGWIFHTFAAGLVLYWACFSILSLLDYFLFKRKATKNPHVQKA